jgi:hypothetical protein
MKERTMKAQKSLKTTEKNTKHNTSELVEQLVAKDMRLASIRPPPCIPCANCVG